jgi:hypothetical protein
MAARSPSRPSLPRFHHPHRAQRFPSRLERASRRRAARLAACRGRAHSRAPRSTQEPRELFDALTTVGSAQHHGEHVPMRPLSFRRLHVNSTWIWVSPVTPKCSWPNRLDGGRRIIRVLELTSVEASALSMMPLAAQPPDCPTPAHQHARTPVLLT